MGGFTPFFAKHPAAQTKTLQVTAITPTHTVQYAAQV